MSIEPGKIVWLKTGSPAMTVKFLNQREEWLCTWFVGQEVKEHSFTQEQLTEEEPDDSIDVEFS
ncbi:MAG: DUF2158 domain-containing protein [Reichenbachiella sp.]|uniref:DUF2158 domain-containing protein n=1 Tax=Reichenbachiella sp. TaxID=2184521 RepID=UPI0032981201